MTESPARDVADIVASARAHFHAGNALLAYDSVTQALERSPDDIRLRQLQALALARAGAREPAITALRRLADAGHEDEETLGVLASVYKDLSKTAAAPADRVRYRQEAARIYLRAYELTGGSWTGINAATLML